MQKEQLLNLLSKFTGQKIVIVGDLFLDEYILGKATRLSREAPVPVIEFERQFSLPGAAANPANNIQTLGGQAFLVGVIGNDEAGTKLKQRLHAAGIDTSGLVVDSTRSTITKTRILAGDGFRTQQQIARIDRLGSLDLDTAVKRRITDILDRVMTEADALLLSDYKCGTVCQEVIDASRQLALRWGKVVTVDSQGDLFKFKGMTLVKANQQEAEAVLRRPLDNEESFKQEGNYLLQELQAQAVVITRGGEGMSIIQPGSYTHIPVENPSEVFDVTGAGDTTIAVLTQALAAKANLIEAGYLANLAAGIVVRKLGNATTTQAELRQAIEKALS